MLPHLTNAASNAFDRGTDPILSMFSIDQAKQLIEYRGEATIQNRIQELADKNTEGTLSDEERAEYEGYVRANNFIAVLQAKARKILKASEK